MRALFLVLIWAVLGGCAHGSGGLDVGAGCPALKVYPAARQRAVRAELKACGQDCRALSAWIKDYYVLRQQIRVCRASR